MSWIEDSVLTSGWVTDKDIIGGVTLDFVNQFGDIVSLSVNDSGVLITALSQSLITPDPFKIRATDGKVYRMDTDANLVLSPVEDNVINYPFKVPRLASPLANTYDVGLNGEGVFVTTRVDA